MCENSPPFHQQGKSQQAAGGFVWRRLAKADSSPLGLLGAEHKLWQGDLPFPSGAGSQGDALARG